MIYLKQTVGSCLDDIIANNSSTDAVLDRCLDTGSLAQHKGKSEATVWFTGPKAYTHQREAFIKNECGNVSRDARYLGPRLHYAHFFFPEKEARLQVAKKRLGVCIINSGSELLMSDLRCWFFVAVFGPHCCRGLFHSASVIEIMLFWIHSCLTRSGA